MKTKTGILLAIFGMLSLSVNAQDVFDSDGDGFDDNNDNCTLIANPLQRDTDGDALGNMCDADFNGDMIINFADYSYLGQNFLTADPDADLNGDGSVNFVDISHFATLFLEVPGPTGTDPNQPPCTCYFSSDCPSGTFCDYGPGSFGTEDICVWRNIKPNGVVDAGCSIETNLTTGAWIPDICDGVCAPTAQGSYVGIEDVADVAQTIAYWAEAMIGPSEAGGGVVDEVIAQRALDMQFSVAEVPIMLGRYAADALAMAAGEPFHDYFCHYEGHPEDENQPIVNIAGDTCRIASARLTLRALVSELENPGTARAIMEPIAEACPNWQSMFGTECDAGPNALNCAITYIEDEAKFLSTSPVRATEGVSAIMQMLGETR